MSKNLLVDYIPFEISRKKINESMKKRVRLSEEEAILEMHWKGDDLLGTVEVLSTPAGNILKELFKSGIKLGISSRGLGSVEEINEGDGDDEDDKVVKVQPDFELIAFDFVSNPSTQGAFLHPVKEGINEGVGTRKGVCCHDCKIETIINDIFRGE